MGVRGSRTVGRSTGVGFGKGRNVRKPSATTVIPAFKASGAVGAATTGTTVSAPLPTYAANDILIIQAICRSSVTAFSAISGWTEITQFTVDTHRVGFWWKRSSASESAPTVTNAGRTSTNLISAQMSSWSGCKATGTPYEGLGNNSSASGVLAGVAVLTAGVKRLALQLWIRGANSASAPDGEWTERLDQGTSGGGACRHMIDSAPVNNARTVAACSRGSSAQLFGMIGLALIPADPA